MKVNIIKKVFLLSVFIVLVAVIFFNGRFLNKQDTSLKAQQYRCYLRTYIDWNGIGRSHLYCPQTFDRSLYFKY